MIHQFSVFSTSLYSAKQELILTKVDILSADNKCYMLRGKYINLDSKISQSVAVMNGT